MDAVDSKTTAGEMTCPTCNARQVWSDQCRRCKADLSLLRQIWRSAEDARQQCLHELAAGRAARALRHAQIYAAYVGWRNARRLLAVCYLCNEDWQRATRG
jgi:hypothetical protein